MPKTKPKTPLIKIKVEKEASVKKQDPKTPPVEIEVIKEAPKESVPKRIRMNFAGANQHRTFEPGDILKVPAEIPADTARSYLRSGKAEQDKAGEGPAETK